jgi:hypothetical protein
MLCGVGRLVCFRLSRSGRWYGKDAGGTWHLTSDSSCVDDDIVQLGRESFQRCHRKGKVANIRLWMRADEQRAWLNVLVFSVAPEVEGGLWA